jgi:hypothetical protein
MLDVDEFYIKYPQYKNRLSWQVYRAKGYTCLRCGLTGDKAALWTDLKDGDPRSVHTDLVGFDKDGDIFMITRDHIHPRSKGGPTNIENLQPLCSLCNARKSDRVESYPDETVQSSPETSGSNPDSRSGEQSQGDHSSSP